MSFFNRLRQRLTKSSAKIDEGVDALLESGDVTVEPGPQPAAPPAEPPGAKRLPESAEAPAPQPEAEAAPERSHAGEPETRPEPEPPAAPSPPQEPPTQPRPESEDRAAPAPRETPPGPAAPPASRETPPGPAAQPAPQAREVSPAPSPQTPSNPTGPAAPQSRETPPDPPPPLEPRAPQAREPEPAKPEPAPERRGFFSRLTGGGRPRPDAPAAQTSAAPPPPPAAPERRRVLDDEMLEGLEELLISADLGVETSMRVSAAMAEGRFGRRLGAREIKAALADEVSRILDPVARPLPIYPKRPQVVLVVGVNGSGKTTTIGKLASQLKSAGKSVVIAAGDTFRAAAVEQLQIWGDRAGVPVLKAGQGTDPAALAFQALEKAQAEGADMLLIDTAGRLQNRADLMEELAKIVRVLKKRDESAPHNTVLVLDATTGQNALTQVEIFQKVANVTGLVMTKLDGTAKGGVLVALADRFGLPIHAVGVGEAIDDLQPFDPEEFAAALTGAERG